MFSRDWANLTESSIVEEGGIVEEDAHVVVVVVGIPI